MFQADIMNDQTKQGFCDRDTINALVDMDNYSHTEGWYDSTDLLLEGFRHDW